MYGKVKLVLAPAAIALSLAAHNVHSSGLQRVSQYPHPPLGAHPLTSTSAVGTSFSVWAPNADSVSVVGTFNNWDGTVDKLRRFPDGVWRGKSTAARPGDEYMFLLDGRLERRDPRAREVTPAGRCVVQPPPPPPSRLERPLRLSELVIYQMHVGTFNDPSPADAHPGTLDDAASKLDHLADLGVNCVLLMPVNEFPFERSWGYNPKDIFAVESAYGGPAALRRFVSECHRRGIAVHMDIVHNHYGPSDLDLWDFDTEGKSPPSPHSPQGIYFYQDDRRSATPWGPRPNFGKKEVARFISDQVRMWFDEYGMDGLRWDSTANIRALNNGHTPNLEGERLVDRVTRMIRREYPEKINIAEDSPGDRRFDASWDYDFHHDAVGGVVENLLRRAPSEVDVQDIASRMESELGFGRVIYSESHDEAGLLNSKTRLLTTADPSDPLSASARRTAALAATLVMTAPSVPMIFMGQELGEKGSFHDDLPLKWELCPAREGLLNLYRDLIYLRRGAGGRTDSLQSPRIKMMMVDEREKLLVFRRHTPSRSDSDIVVALNLGDRASTLPLPFPAPGRWIPILGTESDKYAIGESPPPSEVNVPGSRRLDFPLAPRSAVIFARHRIPLPSAPVPSMVTTPPSPSPSPHLPDPQETSPAQSPFVVANFTNPPWSEDRGDLGMSPAGENVWMLELQLESSSSVELKIVDPRSSRRFGGNLSSPSEHLPLEGILDENDRPIAIPGPVSGSYRLMFNDRTMRYRLEPRHRTSLDRVNVLSSENDWNRVSDPMHMVADYLWQADLPTHPEDEVEFVLAADGGLENQWGGETGKSPPLEWSGAAELLGPPVKVRASSEGIRILFDERESKISVRPLQPSEIPHTPPPPPPRPPREGNHLPTPGDGQADGL